MPVSSLRVLCSLHTLSRASGSAYLTVSEGGFHAALSVSGIICKLCDLESLALLVWYFLALSSVNFLKVFKDFFVFGSRKNMSNSLRHFHWCVSRVLPSVSVFKLWRWHGNSLSQSIHSSVLWGTLLKVLLMYQASVCWDSLWLLHRSFVS